MLGNQDVTLCYLLGKWVTPAITPYQLRFYLIQLLECASRGFLDGTKESQDVEVNLSNWRLFGGAEVKFVIFTLKMINYPQNVFLLLNLLNASLGDINDIKIVNSLANYILRSH